jgi:membrane protease subunit HflK
MIKYRNNRHLAAFNWLYKKQSDIEKMMQDMQQQIKKYMQGRSSPQGAEPDANHAPFALIVLGLLALLWLATGTYTVQQSEQGVITRFGQFHRLAEPGLRWHLPSPFERVEIVNRDKVRSVAIGYMQQSNQATSVTEESLMVTEDQNIIDVQLAIQYTITDVKAYLFNNNAQATDAADVVKSAAEASVREIVGRNELNFVLNEGRAQIAADVKDLLQTILDKYQIGIAVVSVNVQNVQPPQKVQAAFNDAVKAGQDKDKLRNQGLSYRNDILPKAQGMADRLVAEAEGYQLSVLAKAEGDVSRFNAVLSEYAASPKTMRDRLYFETMQEVMQSTTKILVDQKSGNNLLYLPLDQLMKKDLAANLTSKDQQAVTSDKKPADAIINIVTPQPTAMPDQQGRPTRPARP